MNNISFYTANVGWRWIFTIASADTRSLAVMLMKVAAAARCHGRVQCHSEVHRSRIVLTRNPFTIYGEGRKFKDLLDWGTGQVG